MKYIKTVGYGIVSKSIKLQVFMSPKMYLELVNEARNQNLPNRTDSQLIGAVLYKFLSNVAEMGGLKYQVEQLKTSISEKNLLIEQLKQELTDIKIKKVKKK